MQSLRCFKEELLLIPLSCCFEYFRPRFMVHTGAGRLFVCQVNRAVSGSDFRQENPKIRPNPLPCSLFTGSSLLHHPAAGPGMFRRLRSGLFEMLYAFLPRADFEGGL
jgi:hypothetical protein